MSAAAHAYLNTRVSIMAARLFPETRIEELSALDLAALSDRFGLGAALEAAWPTRAKSRALEQALIGALWADAEVLLRPMTADERALIVSWARKFALFNLKAFLRGKIYDLDPAAIRDHLYDLPAALRLPHPELFRAENVLELLRLLERSPYGAIARQAREVYEHKRDPFALESAIDQRYYGELLRRMAQLPDDSQTPLRRLLGSLLDRVNLLWLLRFRFTYQFSPSETFYQLVPSPRLLHRKRLLELVNLEGFVQVLEALPAPLAALMHGADNLLEVQRRANRYLIVETRRILALSSSGVARAFAYLLLREADLSLLFALLQGRLLGLPEELVRAALDRGPAVAGAPLAAAA